MTILSQLKNFLSDLFANLETGDRKSVISFIVPRDLRREIIWSGVSAVTFVNSFLEALAQEEQDQFVHHLSKLNEFRDLCGVEQQEYLATLLNVIAELPPQQWAEEFADGVDTDRGSSVSISPAIPSGVDVFISYSHRDRRSLEQKLLPALSMLQRQGKISAWYDGRIEPGTERSPQIEQTLNMAHMILLLVSADFLASDSCYGKEMNRAIERHKAGDARVIPIILRPCDWKNAPFAQLEVLPMGGRAVTKWPNRDDAWTDVAQGIRRTVESLIEHAYNLNQERK